MYKKKTSTSGSFINPKFSASFIEGKLLSHVDQHGINLLEIHSLIAAFETIVAKPFSLYFTFV